MRSEILRAGGSIGLKITVQLDPGSRPPSALYSPCHALFSLSGGCCNLPGGACKLPPQWSSNWRRASSPFSLKSGARRRQRRQRRGGGAAPALSSVPTPAVMGLQEIPVSQRGATDAQQVWRRQAAAADPEAAAQPGVDASEIKPPRLVDRPRPFINSIDPAAGSLLACHYGNDRAPPMQYSVFPTWCF